MGAVDARMGPVRHFCASKLSRADFRSKACRSLRKYNALTGSWVQGMICELTVTES